MAALTDLSASVVVAGEALVLAALARMIPWARMTPWVTSQTGGSQTQAR